MVYTNNGILLVSLGHVPAVDWLRWLLCHAFSVAKLLGKDIVVDCRRNKRVLAEKTVLKRLKLSAKSQIIEIFCPAKATRELRIFGVVEGKNAAKVDVF